jgi:O-antigen/teichoic acid export membrane protein
VFFQKSAELYHSSEVSSFQDKVVSVFYGTFFLCVTPFGVVYAFGELLFVWFAGENWSTAGTLASYLAIASVFQFIWSSISSLFKTLRRERLLFWIDISGSVFIMITFIVSIQFALPIDQVILILGVSMAVRFLFSLAVLFCSLRISFIKHTIAIVFLTAIVFWGVDLLSKFFE